MNDDQYSERELMAVSAYLDGEATPDERALVEASPQLTAMVAEWQEVRDQTVSVQASAASREAALAAALGAFDELHATVPAATDNVVHLERRRRQYRFIMGAAAAVAVVFGGLVILQSGGDSDDDDFTVAVAPKASGMAEDAAASAMEAAPADESATQMAPASGDMSSEAEAPAATEAPADTEAAAAGLGDPDVLPMVDGPEQLSAYYAANRSVVPSTAPTGDGAPSTTREACPTGPDLVIGKVAYRGVPALVVISNDGDELRAIDASSCVVLLTTTP